MKMTFLSLFNHPQVVPNLYEFLCSAEQRKIFWRKFVTRLFWAPLTSIVGQKILWKSMVPQNCSVSHILQNIFLCDSEQRHSCRFGTSREWVNDDRIFIFGWTIPLRLVLWSKVTYSHFLPLMELNYNWHLSYSPKIHLFCSMKEVLHTSLDQQTYDAK